MPVEGNFIIESIANEEAGEKKKVAEAMAAEKVIICLIFL